MVTWEYADSIGVERIHRLQSEESFHEIAARIDADLSVLCFHLQRCDDDNRYARAVFCVQVAPALFDAFFNSPAGYRGCFYSSPFTGLEANHLLMERLLPRIMTWLRENEPGCDSSFVAASLTALSAKAWLAETSMELCVRCTGEWSYPQDALAEIRNDRWDRGDAPKARIGRKAPVLSKIRLMGTFLNSAGDEFVPRKKRRRAWDIHDFGWS